MQIKLKHIKLIGLLLVVVGLYSFAGYRNNLRPGTELEIKFLGDNNLYITEESVNKLLIQKYGPLKNRAKEEVVLNSIEEVIQSNPMVKNAQVYRSVNGTLISKIVQRKPIGRVEGVSRFYLDDEGKRMPLSRHHSARVPIITGKITEKTLEDAYAILEYINKDDFLRKNVIGIHLKDEDQYQLKLRVEEFVVHLGSVENLDEKFKNFMAFYVKAAKDKSLNSYAMVSLEFDNQVVCTKI
ncbi:cell division protein FtsQ/DivIB [Flavobacterium sp. ASW18X]|uniref:cell division protein FtsQ/DivIB n=1 Tax=Flavobacterium sp. ASW18X TaxID=2572595 RepID=UPI0010AE5B0D|nr:cell division protein FtsQ/DivIB [Flavobacterium sp. ASW18X]TKD66784.1 hypothetical protein FBT53_02705 [Flavobacterium sp. ASW18X]